MGLSDGQTLQATVRTGQQVACMTSSYNGCIEVDVEKVIEAQAASLEGAKLSKMWVAQLHAGQIVHNSGGSIHVHFP